MKRTLATVAAAGLLTFGLAACGEDTETETPEAPAPEQTEEPDDGGMTTEEPGDGGMMTEEPGDGGMMTEEPGDGGMTTEPDDGGMMTEEPGDGGMTTAPPGAGPADPEAAEWCMNLAELGQDSDFTADLAGDPEQALGLLQDLREGAPEPIAADLDVMIEGLEAVSSGDTEGVDPQAIQEAAGNFQTNVVETCTGAM